MKKTKKILSLLTALTITASAFASLAIPASADGTPAAPTADPAGVIDFTNRTLTQTAKGNKTTFVVEDAANSTDTKLNAAALAAADAGNVLKLGASERGGGKMLGYTAPLKVDGSNVVEYSGQVKMSFKLEPIQVRTDQDAANIVLQFSDITKEKALFPITIHCGSLAQMDVNGEAVSTPFGKYYTVEEEFNFDTHKGAITIKDSAGTSIYTKSGVDITADNLAYLHYPDHDWLYGTCGIDDITLEATQIGAPVYYTAVVNTTRYAKMVTSDNKTYFADVNGKLTVPLIKPNTTFDYTLSKEGYTDVTGTIAVTDADVTQDKPLTITDPKTLFVESEFGNANEAYVSAGGSRNDSVSLGEYTLPAMSEINIDFNFAGFGNNAGQQKTWDIETDGGKLVGIQINDNGLFAWTGWTGTGNMNQSDDIGKYTNSVRLGDAPSGDFSIKFVVGTAAKGITILYNNDIKSLTYAIDATKITGMATGLYRYNGELQTKKLAITAPDANFMSITGATGFAKVSGKTIERNYNILQTVVNESETFTWTVTRADNKATTGITLANGKLSVADTAEPGTITINCASATNNNKKASLDVEIGDFQQIAADKFAVDGPQSYDVTDTTGTYKVTKAVDSFGDDVLSLLPAAKWTSSNAEVATINADTGVLTVVGAGETTVTATITNGTAVTTATIPVVVNKYSIVADVTPADATSMTIPTTGIYKDGISSYLVTTAKDGKIVKQVEMPASEVTSSTTIVTKASEAGIKVTATYDANGVLTNLSAPTTVAAGDTMSTEGTATTKNFYWTSLEAMKPIEEDVKITTTEDAVTVDTTGATKVEVAPIFTGSVGTTYQVPVDRYNVTATVSNGRRADLYVNDQMLMNNLNQGSDNWALGKNAAGQDVGGGRNIAESTDYEANDIMINQGYAKFNLRDDQSSGTLVTGVKFVKAPEIVTRAKRVYAIGDSLVAKYYGEPKEGYEARVRTGWGDVLQNYIKDAEVTNLGNSGAWATGMLSDAFTNVMESAQTGDVLVLESGYNDKSHSTVPDMTAAVTEMVTKANEKGLTVFVVTPNASVHDYKESVAWAAQLKDICATIKTANPTYSVNVIDLSAESYKYLATHYGTDISGEENASAAAKAARNTLLTYYNNTGDTLHSTTNAANVWAAIVATGIKSVVPAIVDTEYTYQLNDGSETAIAVKVDMNLVGDFQFGITAPTGYTVTDAADTAATPTVITKAKAGTTVKVTVPVGVDLNEVLVNDGNVAVTKGEGFITFTMPMNNVTVTVKTYDLTLDNATKALITRVKADGTAETATKAAKGETVYYKAVTGKNVADVKFNLTPAQGETATPASATYNAGVFSFTMPGGNTTVTATETADPTLTVSAATFTITPATVTPFEGDPMTAGDLVGTATVAPDATTATTIKATGTLKQITGWTKSWKAEDANGLFLYP